VVIFDSLLMRFTAAVAALTMSTAAFDAGLRGAFVLAAPQRVTSHAGDRRLSGLLYRHLSHAPETGEAIFRATCAGCHGDGKGAPQTTVAFAVPLPDFTDCKSTTPETTADWAAVIRDGGPVRGFSQIMPAFRDMLTPEQIQRVVAYMRSLCTDSGWPVGEFNVPLAQVTEKAFPEDEVVLTSAASTRAPRSFENHLIFESRLGKREQLEVDVPFGFVQRPGHSWTGGLGDVSIAAKHVIYSSLPSRTIVSGLAGVVLPTAAEGTGLGTGVTSFEALVLGARLLPKRSFFQFEAGLNQPVDLSLAPRSAFWSGAIGKTIAFSQITRIWSPMIEVAGSRDLIAGAPTDWSLVPEFQLSLSALQHVRAGVGVNIPLTERDTRSSQIQLYLLWDTFDGPFFSGWKGRCTGCEH
jgi:mono/diheme cytochrome c family protein